MSEIEYVWSNVKERYIKWKDSGLTKQGIYEKTLFCLLDN